MQNALFLLATGMLTVFVILTLVVVSGNLTIRIINNYFPGPVQTNGSSSSTEIAPEVVAVISATVDEVTEGQGRIEKIKKL